MSFFSDFSTTFNEIADATFNTLVFKANKQSNEVGQEYAKLLSDPNFKTTREVKRILMMDANQARKAFGINLDASNPAQSQPQPAKKPRTRKPAASSASN